MTSPDFIQPDITANSEYLESERIKSQELIYTERGLTVERVQTEIPTIAAARKDPSNDRAKFFNHENSFYLASSDALSVVDRKLDVRGQRVMTVAGSGDFAQAFIKNGARDVIIFDLSFPACFWQELKLAAAKALSFESYQKLFGNIHMAYESDDQEFPLIDWNEFLAIKNRLTPQAQVYFEELANTGLMQLTDYDQAYERFYRLRDKEQLNFFTQNRNDYETLQRNLQSSTYQIIPGEISALSSNLTEAPDMVYLSNISYKPSQSHNLASQLLNNKVKRVVCAWRVSGLVKDLNLEQVPAYKLTDGEIFSGSDLDSGKIKELNDTGAEMVDLIVIPDYLNKAELSLDPKFEKGVIFSEGFSFIWKGLNVKVLGIDSQKNFGLIVELTLPTEKSGQVWD